MIGISACLGGSHCRYDGKNQSIDELMILVSKGEAEIVCPEVLGGLEIPRNPAEIIGGDGEDVWKNQAKVIDNTGVDVTNSYKEGAKKAYTLLQEKGISTLILKEKSPSCGTHLIYDGSFSGIKVKGMGVATAYFKAQGIKVYSDVEYQIELFTID